MKSYDPEWLWETKDGQKIKVSELADDHLVEILRFLRQTVEQQIADRAYQMRQNRDNCLSLGSQVGTKMDKMHILSVEAGLRGLSFDMGTQHVNADKFKGKRLNRRQRRELKRSMPGRAHRTVNT